MGAAFAATVALAGCGSPEEPPPKPIVGKSPAPPPPSPAPLPLPPAPDATLSRDPEKAPQAATPDDPSVQSPSYIFRTMDHRPADVFINGHLHGSTAFLWCITANSAFDPKIPVSVWPPPGAKACGSRVRRSDDGTPISTLEIFIDGGHYEQEAFSPLRKQYPHLVDGEHILYLRATWGSSARVGAVRLRVVGKDGALYRWIHYVAYLSDEDENAFLFKRALWFYALRSE